MQGEFRFLFLGVVREIRDARDWNRPDWPKLWLYNAHYFDDLVAADAEQRKAWHHKLVARWVAENAPGQGIGWEPYPTSLRVVNWLKWALAFNPLPEDVRQSLAQQVRWLRRRLEWHLLGNHLWANAKALIFAGACFEGQEADGWLAKGVAIAIRELDEQVLPDGGHFERSPMYHAIFLEDVLDLLQLAQRFPGRLPERLISPLQTKVGSLFNWLRAMTHPDGEIALFNDAAFEVAPRLAALSDYADAIGIEWMERPEALLADLPASGYVRAVVADAVVIGDLALIGPDYLPGHAHADTLSFEWSLAGRRVIVNGGTSTYENDAERRRQRGTAAHSTLAIDDEDSSEVWGAFRVARRARVHDRSMALEDGDRQVLFSAAHDGYARLHGRPIHHRSWSLTPGRLIITDRVRRFAGHRAIIRFHLSPQWLVDSHSAEQIVLVSRDGEGNHIDVEFSPGATTRIVPWTWTPAFGQSELTWTIERHVVEGKDLFHETQFTWGL